MAHERVAYYAGVSTREYELGSIDAYLTEYCKTSKGQLPKGPMVLMQNIIQAAHMTNSKGGVTVVAVNLAELVRAESDNGTVLTEEMNERIGY